MIPESIKAGTTQLDRVNSILEVAEPLLHVDRLTGERAYIRRQPNGVLFVTRDPLDTIKYPLGSAREGIDRYVWDEQPDGVKIGWLKRAG